jgi:hypothetical protein
MSKKRKKRVENAFLSEKCNHGNAIEFTEKLWKKPIKNT